MRLPRDPLVKRTGSRFKAEDSLERSSIDSVVRRAAPLITGAVLGLSTLVCHPSPSFLPIRLAAPTDNVFSFGGLQEVAAVGLRRRCARLTAAVTFPPFVDERRLIA